MVDSELRDENLLIRGQFFFHPKQHLSATQNCNDRLFKINEKKQEKEIVEENTNNHHQPCRPLEIDEIKIDINFGFNLQLHDGN